MFWSRLKLGKPFIALTLVLFLFHLAMIEVMVSWVPPKPTITTDSHSGKGFFFKPVGNDIELLMPRSIDHPAITGFSNSLWQQSANEKQLNIPWNTSHPQYRSQYKANKIYNLGVDKFAKVLFPSSPWKPSMTFKARFGIIESGLTMHFDRSAIRVNDHSQLLSLEYLQMLSVWTNSLLLRPTTVQVLLDSNATVLSAYVIPPGSGVGVVDQEALRIARCIRFRGVDHSESPFLRWEMLNFVWRSALPASKP